ncbi:hypothetical protein Gotri_013378, partial [Gossypium trilobum]|nr:hypothetical protein [Gossypium trilobum]
MRPARPETLPGKNSVITTIFTLLNALDAELVILSDLFARLPKLQVLYLAGNKLSGKIPLGLFKCKELEYIEFGYNSLEGILPKEIGNL